MKRFGIWPAIALVLGVNLVVFAGVTYNRSEPFDASLELTERELEVTRSGPENTGLFLRLNWDIPIFDQYSAAYKPPDFLDFNKMKELGYPCQDGLSRPYEDPCYRRQLPIKAYIVLEYEGASWHRWLEGNENHIEELEKKILLEEDSVKSKNLQNQKSSIERMRVTKSRLFAIDAGLDADALRRKYIDSSRYIIAPGLIRFHYTSDPKIPKTGKRGPYRIRGVINEILVDQIMVPYEFRELVRQYSGSSSFRYRNYKKSLEELRPRYQVKLLFGKRHEPWIASIATLN